MADHSIHFTPEQNLLLDKYVADKEAAEAELARVQGQLQEAKRQVIEARAAAQALRQQLAQAGSDSAHPDEEVIRKDEREKFAVWIENGGHDEEHIYMMTSASGAMAIQEFVPDAIRSAEHMMTYAEYRREGEPDWPEGYDMGEADYDFDVNTTVWDRLYTARGSAAAGSAAEDFDPSEYDSEW